MLSSISELTCNVCSDTKPIHEFKKHKACTSGYIKRCKKCVNRLEIESYRRNNPGALYRHEYAKTEEETRERKAKNNIEHYQNNKVKISDYRKEYRLKKYGITQMQYEEMLDRQGGVCAICGSANGNGRILAVDHDHITEKVRGLLCGKCNMGLGMFCDNPEILLLAYSYLEEK